MTRKQTGRLPNKHVTFESPLILLNDSMKDAILSYLYNDLYFNVNNIKEVDNALDDTINVTHQQDQKESKSCNDEKKRKFETLSTKNKNENEDENKTKNYLINFTSSKVAPMEESKDGEFKNILEKLGVSYHPLDESFSSSNKTASSSFSFSSSLPASSLLLAASSDSSSPAASSIFPDSGIPVLQVLLIDENMNTADHNSENFSSLAYLRPVRQCCTFALLVLPSSDPLSLSLHPVNNNKNILKSNTKVVLKSTKSLAYVQIDE